MRHLRPPLGAEGPVVLRVSSYATFLQALRSGMGLGVLPELLGAREPLERVGDLYDMVLPLWVLTHPDLRATPRIRAVMDGIVAFHGA
jgi:DNA-binding transcriptional LysR family regulator